MHPHACNSTLIHACRYNGQSVWEIPKDPAAWHTATHGGPIPPSGLGDHNHQSQRSTFAGGYGAIYASNHSNVSGYSHVSNFSNPQDSLARPSTAVAYDDKGMLGGDSYGRNTMRAAMPMQRPKTVSGGGGALRGGEPEAGRWGAWGQMTQGVRSEPRSRVGSELNSAAVSPSRPTGRTSVAGSERLSQTPRSAAVLHTIGQLQSELQTVKDMVQSTNVIRNPLEEELALVKQELQAKEDEISRLRLLNADRRDALDAHRSTNSHRASLPGYREEATVGGAASNVTAVGGVLRPKTGPSKSALQTPDVHLAMGKALLTAGYATTPKGSTIHLAGPAGLAIEQGPGGEELMVTTVGERGVVSAELERRRRRSEREERIRQVRLHACMHACVCLHVCVRMHVCDQCGWLHACVHIRRSEREDSAGGGPVAPPGGSGAARGGSRGEWTRCTLGRKAGCGGRGGAARGAERGGFREGEA